MTRESANRYVQEVFEMAARLRCDRQLIDHRETSFALSVAEYYERPEINRELGLSLKWKIAMVFRELSPDTQFMENVFRNRGYNFRQFDKIEEAREWVLSND